MRPKYRPPGKGCHGGGGRAPPSPSSLALPSCPPKRPKTFSYTVKKGKYFLKNEKIRKEPSAKSFARKVFSYYTLIKKKKKFHIYKEFQKGAVAKSYI
jgi:hypothetical protein